MEKNNLKQFTPEMRKILSMMSTGVNVYDFENKKIIWGNPSGVDLWNCENLEELQNIDMSGDTLRRVIHLLETN